MMLQIDIPADVYMKALEIARGQQMRVEDVVTDACAEHVAAWERLQRRAANADREKFMAVLAKAPGVDPVEADR